MIRFEDLYVFWFFIVLNFRIFKRNQRIFFLRINRKSYLFGFTCFLNFIFQCFLSWFFGWFLKSCLSLSLFSCFWGHNLPWISKCFLLTCWNSFVLQSFLQWGFNGLLLLLLVIHLNWLHQMIIFQKHLLQSFIVFQDLKKLLVRIFYFFRSTHKRLLLARESWNKSFKSISHLLTVELIRVRHFF